MTKWLDEHLKTKAKTVLKELGGMPMGDALTVLTSALAAGIVAASDHDRNTSLMLCQAAHNDLQSMVEMSLDAGKGGAR